MAENDRAAYVLVDDDEQDRFLLRLALEAANRPLPIREFASGEHLLDYLTQHQNGPAGTSLKWVVVLDVNLPRLNGLQTLKRLQQNPHWATFPVIILSSSADKSLVETFYLGGARGYVAKPSSSAELVELFDRFIAPLLKR